MVKPIPMLRRAKIADLEDLIALSVQTFRDTYGEYNTPEDMDAYLSSAFNRDRIRKELTEPTTTYLLADVEGECAGYAKLQYRKPPPCVTGPEPLELARIYAQSRWHGKGVGAALMRACLEQCRIQHKQTLWLGVWGTNTNAVRFYERWGFHSAGNIEFTLGSDIQTDIVMVRTV